MPSFTVKIADELFQVSPANPYAVEHLLNFIADEPGGVPISVTDEIKRMIVQKLCADEELHGTRPGYYGFGKRELFAYLYLISRYMLTKDTLLVHGSAVVTGGKAYLFIAPSGTGKSTHTSLWCEVLGEKAFVINDDKPFLRPTADGIITFATPWGLVDKPPADRAPVAAIIDMTRGSETKLYEVSPSEFILPLYKASVHGETPEEAKTVMRLIQEVLNSVRLYKMTCTPDAEAAKAAIAVLTENE